MNHIAKAVAAQAAARAKRRRPSAHIPSATPKPGRCVACSGSGFKTDSRGVCTTDTDCGKCKGTGEAKS